MSVFINKHTVNKTIYIRKRTDMTFNKLPSVASPVQGEKEWTEVFFPSLLHVNPVTAEDFRALESATKCRTQDTRYRKREFLFFPVSVFFVFFFFFLALALALSACCLGPGRQQRMNSCACSIKRPGARSRPLIHVRRKAGANRITPNPRACERIFKETVANSD